MQARTLSQERTNSLLIAVILCINTFSKVLGVFVTIPYNIVMMECAVLVLLAFVNGRRLLIKQELIVILLVVAGIMGYSLVLFSFDGRVVERLLKFVMYALFAMICIQYPFDEVVLNKSICAIGVVHAGFLFLYAAPRMKSGIISVDTTMDLSYTSLIYLFACWRIAGNRKVRYSLRVCSVIMLCAFTYFLAVISMNRGALVAAACYFALLFVIRIKKMTTRIACFVLVVCCAVVLYTHLIPVLEAVDNFTSSYGVIINPLRKTIQQMNYSDSMISGREDVYEAAIQLIKETWALPNGVASFHILTAASYYPHNIFLEAGVELGLVGFLLVTMIILKACRAMLIHQSKYTHMILLFFCLSIPRLMVSSSYWENSYIWPMMMLLWSTNTRNAE